MNMCIYINLEDYIAEWFIHEQGGCTPVHLTRGSVESKLLEVYLVPFPPGGRLVPKEEEGKNRTVSIMIPNFRNRPPERYNYLPERAMRALHTIIRNRFDVQLWTDLHGFGKIGQQQQDLIYAWMEKHGITPSEKNWCTIAKRYQRQRTHYLKVQSDKARYDKKKCMISCQK